MVYVETNEFFNSHGKQPKGRGIWVFEIDGKNYWFSKTGIGMTYGEAKKEAIKIANKVGAFRVKVIP